MSRTPSTVVCEAVELIEGDALSVEQLARLCGVAPQWVLARVRDELLSATWRGGVCTFSATTVWRAQQMAAIERQFDADPALAALVADLSEELQRLRAELAYCRARGL
ncbi:MerR family transcriptional regulator [Tepidimonas charontis]|uniref:Chaperone modulatory protein CbpM n=1 Tax=Tepidimonas charontis TaxID=2267262 RepID=A0A554XGQ5_9BURK|nr:MerR family transcriptional regulator [Tepidimonas charontis]TSE35010.1 hypothetical protein Tchar_01068 [Tepidimonas charontis]